MTEGHLTQAKIVRVVSTLGTYDVLASSGTRFKNAIALSETTSCLYGVGSSITYQPGSMVIIFVPEEAVSGNRVAFIVGSATDNALPSDKGNPYNKMAVLHNAMSPMMDRSDTSLKYVAENTESENDYSYGKASDILPGEWAKTTYLGGGFFLNDFMLSAGVNERARIEMYYFRDMVRISANNLQQRIAANESVAFLDLGNLNNEVIRKAVSMKESLGNVEGGSPLKDRKQENGLPYSYEYHKEQPYYNYQKVEGDLAQGSLEAYTVPGKDIDKDTPPGVLSVFKGYDGSYEMKSISSIAFLKTSLIPVPWAIQDPDTPLSVDEHSTEYSPEPFPLSYGEPEEGDLAQGSLEAYTIPGKDIDKDTPPGVLSVFKGYDGSYEMKSISSIAFLKTSLIPVPWAIQDPDTPLSVDEHSTEYSPEPFPLSYGEPEEGEVSYFGADAITKQDEYDLEKNSLSKFRVRDKIWTVPKNKEEVLKNLEKAGIAVKQNTELGGLEPGSPYYEEPPVKGVELHTDIDEKGKRIEKSTKKVYDLSSIIKQNPDGSIVISGGYGEEIRMYRGNIYLTCPGDIIKTPGRDSVLMAGGNNIQKANRGTTEIEGKTVTIASDGNMQIAAAVGKESPGTLIIENKSKVAPNLSTYEKDMLENKSTGSGIIIKGKAVATVSDNIYLHAEGDGEGDPLGSSHISMKASSINAVMNKAVSYLQNGGRHLIVGDGNMLGIGGGGVDIVGDNGIRINSDNVVCRSGKVEIPFVDEKNKPTKKIMGTGGGTVLVVQDTIMASNVQSEYSYNNDGEVSKNSPNFSKIFAKIFTKPPPGSSFEEFRKDGLYLEAEFMHKKLKEWGMVLPEKRYTKLELPQCRWQNMRQGDTEMWEPVIIERSFESDAQGDTDVMSYPGKSNFEAEGSLKKLNKDGTVNLEGKLSENLIINSI